MGRIGLAEKMRRLGVLSDAQSEAVAKQQGKNADPSDPVIPKVVAPPVATNPAAEREGQPSSKTHSFMGRPIQTKRGHHPDDVVRKAMQKAIGSPTSWRRPKPTGLLPEKPSEPGSTVQSRESQRLATPPSQFPGTSQRQAFSADVPGEEVSNDCGTCIVRVTRIPDSQFHGHHRIGATRDFDPRLSAIAGHLSAAEGFAPEGRLYFDTETTSLSGGAGVFVFMVGLGRFEGGDFVVYQYFMRHPGEEAALWEALKPLLSEAECLVSFCGKSFDTPRCRDRGLYFCDDALGEHFDRLEHLDLFPTARRLFRHRLRTGKLRAHEDELLGFHRAGDLPGSECPDAWFNYVREVENRSPEIFEHNLWDIVSLASLEALVQQEMQESQDVEAAIAAAQCFALAGDETGFAQHVALAEAQGFALLPPRESVPSPVPRALAVARLLRHRQCFDQADRLLAAIAHHAPNDPRPLVQRAMIAEHRYKDPVRAAEFVARASDNPTLSSRWRAALQHRAARLARAQRTASLSESAAQVLS